MQRNGSGEHGRDETVAWLRERGMHYATLVVLDGRSEKDVLPDRGPDLLFEAMELVGSLR